MRKHLICMCALFLLSLAGLGISHHSVRRGEQITFTEHRVTGQLAAAEGLTINVSATQNGAPLYWDTAFSPGQTPHTKVQLYPNRPSAGGGAVIPSEIREQIPDIFEGFLLEDTIYWIPDLRSDPAYNRFGNQAGIYRLPFTQEKLSFEALELLAPLPEQFELYQFYPLPGNDAILLLTVEKGLFHIRILDTTTGTELLSTPLWPYEEGWDGMLSGETFLLPMHDSGKFQLYARENHGCYCLRFTGQLPQETAFLPMYYAQPQTAAFDGTRLAIAGGVTSGMLDGPHSCGFSLAVFDESGTEYAGVFDSSLDLTDTELPDLYQLDQSWSPLSLHWAHPISP